MGVKYSLVKKVSRNEPAVLPNKMSTWYRAYKPALQATGPCADMVRDTRNNLFSEE